MVKCHADVKLQMQLPSPILWSRLELHTPNKESPKLYSEFHRPIRLIHFGNKSIFAYLNLSGFQRNAFFFKRSISILDFPMANITVRCEITHVLLSVCCNDGAKSRINIYWK